MRIIAGKYKGLRIPVPRHFNDRPTTDFARESLFNILMHEYDLNRCSFLDLFAGTGFISFEMASRGCTDITAVEKNYYQVQFIKRMASGHGFPVNTIQADVYKLLPGLNRKFSLVFADPPYQSEHISSLPDMVFFHGLLENDGLFILEHGKRLQFENHPNFINHRKYSAVHLSFFR